MTTYSAATSNTVSVDVEVPVVVTQLTAVANLAMVDINEPFAISGMLTAGDGSIPVGQTIQLQAVQADGTVADIAGATATTDGSGAYSIPMSEPTVGVFGFQTTYAGGSV